MTIGLTFMIIAVLIVAIWVIFELRRLKHKIFAILLIGLVLFLYVSVTVSIKGQEIDIKSTDGIKTASKIYLSWLGTAFGNMKTLTTNAVKMDWSSENKNYSIGK